MSKAYVVTWTMEIENADSPGDAAQQALAIQRDTSSVATIFDVQEILSTLPSDGRPWQTENHGMFDGMTGERY